MLTVELDGWLPFLLILLALLLSVGTEHYNSMTILYRYCHVYASIYMKNVGCVSAQKYLSSIL